MGFSLQFRVQIRVQKTLVSCQDRKTIGRYKPNWVYSAILLFSKPAQCNGGGAGPLELKELTSCDIKRRGLISLFTLCPVSCRQ